MNNFSILIVDDHPGYRAGLAKIVLSVPRISYLEEAGDGHEALDKLAVRHFDLVILDISMKGMNGIEAARRIKKEFTKTQIIMCSMFDRDDWVIELIDIGVEGYITKCTDTDEIIKAMNTITHGNKYFSPDIYSIWNNFRNDPMAMKRFREGKSLFTSQEVKVIKLLCEGYTVEEISEKLFVEYTTINTHRTHIYEKMKVTNIVGMVKYAIRNGIFIP